MKKLSVMVLGIIVVFSIIFTACFYPTTKEALPKSNEYESRWTNQNIWKVIKSPLTGRCYEVFEKMPDNPDSSFGMSEIPCGDYEKLKNK